MTLALLVLAGLARADPAEDLLRQRQRTQAAAASVAKARADGARRSELAERLRVYREAAAELERLRAAVSPSWEEERLTKLEAVSVLREAVAEGARSSTARDTVVAWVGQPSPAERLALLAKAVDAGLAAPSDIRTGLLLDIVEQADALSVLLAFDTASDLRTADARTLRALSLRRRGFGQAASLAAEVEAQRLDDEAATLRRSAASRSVLAEQVLELRASVAASLEQAP